MISILIPIYQYNAFPLAEEIISQAQQLSIDFELICMDDGSERKFNKENERINTLNSSRFIAWEVNTGSISTRKRLAQMARYDWLLFLDADVTPKHDDFLKTYISEIPSGSQAIFGGFAYTESSIPETSLRTTFGKKREEVAAPKRNQTPYKVVISANFIIKKGVYLELMGMTEDNLYGLDYLFGSLLKKNHVVVKHIDNEVFHLGLDTNPLFLKKTRKAIETLSKLYQDNQLEEHDISLIKAYSKLNVIGLHSVLGWFYKKSKDKMENNLLGESPSLFCYDIYRLGYFCSLTD